MKESFVAPGDPEVLRVAMDHCSGDGEEGPESIQVRSLHSGNREIPIVFRKRMGCMKIRLP